PACPGRPRLGGIERRKTWMARIKRAMTMKDDEERQQERPSIFFQHFHRHARLMLRAADGERGAHARDILRGRELFREEALKGREVRRDALQYEVDLAVQHVALADERPGRDLRLEGLEVGFGLAVQPHHRED